MAKFWSSDAKKLLAYLNDEDTFQLAYTICKARLQFRSKNEAIEMILAACESPEELLRKRKIKRDYLLRYIWEYGRSDNNSNSNCPSAAIKGDKRKLSREILSLWGCNVSNSTIIVEEDEEDEDEDEDEHKEEAQSSSIQQNFDSQLLIEFATKFLRWFYELLAKEEENAAAENFFGPHHFYANCLLRLRCGCGSEENTITNSEIEGDIYVSKRIRDLVMAERLLFQPNLSSLANSGGFRVKQESHGAILLQCNGIVHRRPAASITTDGSAANSGSGSGFGSGSVILGPYEQMFLLIQDPLTSTWKIQQTALNIGADIALFNTTSRTIDYHR